MPSDRKRPLDEQLRRRARELLARLSERNDLPEREAMALALEAQHRTRRTNT